jgi:RNA polymerase sigma factor (sigma-70 family)
MIEEKELIQLSIKKDRLAQKMLFDNYSNSLFSTAFRIVSDYDLAQDIIQESFIAVFRDLKSFKNTCPLFYWIRAIVVRKAIKALKKNRRFEILEDDIATTDFNSDFTAEELDKAILKLPHSCRSVFVMIEVEGYKHKEVAELLNISEGTSKSQLNYSKKLLRKLLKEIYDGR